MWRRIGLIGLLSAIWLTACNAGMEQSNAPTVNPTADSLATVMHQAAQTPSLPPMSLQQRNDPTASPSPSSPSGEGQRACRSLHNDQLRPHYELHAALDWAAKRLQVDQTVLYTHRGHNSVSELVLHVESNRQIGYFQLQGIMADDNQIIDQFTLDFTRLTLTLPQPLDPGCQLTLRLSYSLRIPPVMDGYEGRWGYWGFTERQINLGHWFPMVAPLLNDDWNVPRPYFLGEQITAESSDFELELSLENPPADVLVAGPGLQRELGPNQWQFTLLGARDLALSVGEGLRQTNKRAADGTQVEVYYFPNSAPPGLTPAKQALDSAAEALVLFEELFATQYPYERLVIVEGDFPDGMEFSGLVFVGEAWFRTWRGEPNDWITAITVHEVAHQWWYLLVGNDPANYPYMDEALATYSEYLYFQRYYGELYDWWWDFRVRSFINEPRFVDGTVYQYDNARPYINDVYLTGAKMLHDLRSQLGDAAFFAWLQAYLQNQAYQLATPAALWGMLTPSQYADSAPIRQTFLTAPEVLPLPDSPTPAMSETVTLIDSPTPSMTETP